MTGDRATELRNAVVDYLGLRLGTYAGTLQCEVWADGILDILANSYTETD